MELPSQIFKVMEGEFLEYIRRAIIERQISVRILAERHDCGRHRQYPGDAELPAFTAQHHDSCQYHAYPACQNGL